jgi:hypothetical protein
LFLTERGKKYATRPVFRSGCLPYVLLAYLHHSGFSSQSRHECAKLTWQNWDDR